MGRSTEQQRGRGYSRNLGRCPYALGSQPPARCHPSLLQVEMGPFKHTVDDGLDVRKAAFECMYSLLESCLGQLDICEFLNHVEDGLKDHYDIRVGRAPCRTQAHSAAGGQPGAIGPTSCLSPTPAPGAPVRTAALFFNNKKKNPHLTPLVGVYTGQALGRMV